MLLLRGVIFAGLVAVLGFDAAQAADSTVQTYQAPAPRIVTPPPSARTVIVEPPPAEVAAMPPRTAVIVPPAIAIPDEIVVTGAPVIAPSLAPYGCKRVWRCDAQVCEWRRACNGIYGYVEGPYYNKPLAERQWARDYLPGPNEPVATTRRRVVNPQLK